MIPSGDQTMNSVGFSQMRVTVLSVDAKNLAQCQDQYGRLLPLMSIYNLVGSGALPQPGEEWLVSRENGFYTFKSRIVSNPPTMTTLDTVVQALQALGFASSASSAVSPPSEISGAIKMWPTLVAPSGYLICDGSSYDATTYPALASVFGITSGTFNVPDYRGMVPVGYSSGDADFGTMLGTGGEKTHVLATAEGASHTHSDNGHVHVENQHYHTDGGHNHGNTSYESTQHSHTLSSDTASPGDIMVYSSGSTQGLMSSPSGLPTTPDALSNFTLSAENASHLHGVSTGYALLNYTTSTMNTAYANVNTTATAVGHNNLQPYRTISFIIKT